MKPKPIKLKSKKIGDWVPQDFDRQLTYRGIRWLRVKDGFDGRRRREDWVADLEAGCISVSDYNWKGRLFGIRYGSFKKALAGELKRGLSYLEEDLKRHNEAIAKIKKTLFNLEAALL